MECKLINQGNFPGREGRKEDSGEKVSKTHLLNRVKQITELCEARGTGGDCAN